MTDREEFEVAVNAFNRGQKLDLTKHHDPQYGVYLFDDTECAYRAWQARGALDAVRIKELEAKLDKAKEALKWIDKVNAMDSEYVRVARQALEGLDK